MASHPAKKQRGRLHLKCNLAGVAGGVLYEFRGKIGHCRPAATGASTAGGVMVTLLFVTGWARSLLRAGSWALALRTCLLYSQPKLITNRRSWWPVRHGGRCGSHQKSPPRRGLLFFYSHTPAIFTPAPQSGGAQPLLASLLGAVPYSCSCSLTWGQNGTEPDTVVPARRGANDAFRRPAVIRVGVPTATPQHTG